MWQVWLIISGLFFIMEIATVGFLVFWFGVGALFAMIVSLFTSNIIIQTSVFIITSTLLLFLTKPFVKKLSHTDTVQTNAYSIIGKKGIVTSKITPNHVGQVKVDSETWSAISENEEEINIGTEVEIVEISGVKVIVSPLNVAVTK